MAAETELWFASLPSRDELQEAFARWGELVSIRSGGYRLIEPGAEQDDDGDHDPRAGVPIDAIIDVAAPQSVLALAPAAHEGLRISVMMTGSRGFWLARVTASLQGPLGGVIYVPSTGEAFADAHAYELSWPGEHTHG